MYFGRLGLHINGVWPAQTAKISSKLCNDSQFRRCGSIMCKHKRTTVPSNLGLWISSNLIVHQVTMEQSNDDATTFLKTLLERFNSLEQDVTKLKDKQAPGWGAPMPTADDEKAGVTPEGRKATSQSSSMGKSRGVRQPGPHETSEKLRRSRSLQQSWRHRREMHSVEGLEPMNTPCRRKGKSPSRQHHRWWADPMSNSGEPEAMDYTTESKSEEQTQV